MLGYFGVHSETLTAGSKAEENKGDQKRMVRRDHSSSNSRANSSQRRNTISGVFASGPQSNASLFFDFGLLLEK